MSCSFAFPIEIDLLDSQTVHVGFIDTFGEGEGASVLEGVVVGALLGDVVVDMKALTEGGIVLTSHNTQPTGHALSTVASSTVSLSRCCIGERMLLVCFLRRLGAVPN